MESNWRRERDSNPRRAFDPYTLSRGAPSTTRPSLRVPKMLPVQSGCAGMARTALRGGHDTQKTKCAPKRASRSRFEAGAHEARHRLERSVERLGLAATGLCKVRPAAAPAAHQRGQGTGEFACLDARGLIV